MRRVLFWKIQSTLTNLKVSEGTIASITLFALPEGEEEAQADSDVEPYSVPKAKKDEASLLSHLPTSQNVCSTGTEDRRIVHDLQ